MFRSGAQVLAVQYNAPAHQAANPLNQCSENFAAWLTLSFYCLLFLAMSQAQTCQHFKSNIPNISGSKNNLRLFIFLYITKSFVRSVFVAFLWFRLENEFLYYSPYLHLKYCGYFVFLSHLICAGFVWVVCILFIRYLGHPV